MHFLSKAIINYGYIYNTYNLKAQKYDCRTGKEDGKIKHRVCCWIMKIKSGVLDKFFSGTEHKWTKI